MRDKSAYNADPDVTSSFNEALGESGLAGAGDAHKHDHDLLAR